MTWQRWFGGGLLLLVCLLCFSCSQSTLPTEEMSREAAQENVVDTAVEKPLEGNTTEAPQENPATTEPVPDGSSERTPDVTEPTAEFVPEVQTEKITESLPDVPENEPPVSQTLPEGGGRVCHRHICVETSATAMNKKSLTVVFQSPKQAAPAGSVAPPMDVGPDNWKPADTIFVVFRNITPPGGIRPEQLRVAYVDQGRWLFVDTTYDSQKQEWRGETTHLSVWGLVVSQGACQSNTDCHDAEQCNAPACQPKSCTTQADCQSDEYCSVTKKRCFKQPPCPVRPELCNGNDDNCNGITDEGCQQCRSSAECGPDRICSAGTCQDNCQADQIRCNNQCVDAFSNNTNCGSCNTVCKTTQQCVFGVCVQ